jgi:hypothetical protein
MLRSMIAVTDDEAAKVRPAFERSGALVAAAEMGRLFPGLGAEDAQRAAARTTARWYPGAAQDDGGAGGDRGSPSEPSISSRTATRALATPQSG